MSTSAEQTLDTCGCCEGTSAEIDKRYNPAGLSAFAYRLGTQPQLLQRMKARLHLYRIPDGDFVDQRPLAELATRSPDDPAIAMLDAWATLGDVLTFYQERIANEGFLRTAVERRSVLELARAIGYELNPGVSAETFLSFLVDDADGAPTEAIVHAGTPVQSIPTAQDELPQTFETSKELVAKLSWNAMRPRRVHPQALTSTMTHVYLQGAATGLQKGDLVLLDISGSASPRRVLNIEVDSEAQVSRVDFELASDLVAHDTSLVVGTDAELDILAEPLAFTLANVNNFVFQRTWHEADLQAFFTLHEWDADLVSDYVAQLLAETFDIDNRFIALRESASIFGYNAADWLALGSGARSVYLGNAEADSVDLSDPNEWPLFDVRSPTSTPISETVTGADPNRVFYARSSNQIDLDRVYDKINAEDWVVLGAPGLQESYTATAVIESARAEYGLSGKTTRLTLSGSNLDSFAGLVRETSVFVQNETLDLAPLPVAYVIEAGRAELWLGEMVLGLVTGQRLILSGDDADVADLPRSEIVVLASIRHQAGRTLLEFEDGLNFSYLRESVTLNGNVVPANHGETILGEILGSGSGAETHQRFALKKPPLTHTSAATPSGSEAALSIRVDDIEWRQVASLYELDGQDKAYIVRLDDDGTANIQFGDGKRGARLTTGAENVTADYRSGTGIAGEVDAGSLTLLKQRPYGIREVSNPAAASGGADPEVLEDARDNAPLTVLTLDRIVSVQDYQDFARAFAGIGKARADVVWDGDSERLVLTVADSNGGEVKDTLYDNLLSAIEGARDPLREVVLKSYQPLVFQLDASVLIDPTYRWDDVETAVTDALLAAFDFEERCFALPVSAAEVVSVIHTVAGVIAVDLDHLYVAPPEGGTPTPSWNAVLPAQPARFESGLGLQAAQLLTIHPFGVNLAEMSDDGSTL
ncbi:MAG: putative baseplate assembly protein [Pseudomonadota bacterium]